MFHSKIIIFLEADNAKILDSLWQSIHGYLIHAFVIQKHWEW